jgi:hypothetical protein
MPVRILKNKNNNPKRVIHVTFAILFLLTILSCEKPRLNQVNEHPCVSFLPASLQDISGITGEEISAIKALREKYGSFVFGLDPSSNAVLDKEGESNGYIVLFCDWLAELLGIPVRLEFHERNDLLNGLESGEIDFTSELIDTLEHQETCFITKPILQRLIKIYWIEGGIPLKELIKSRRQP